jgi:hypothetical protein
MTVHPHPDLAPPEPNEPIHLGTAEGKVRTNDRESAAEVTLTLHMLPRPQIAFEALVGEGTISLADVFQLEPGDGRLVIPTRGLDTKFHRSGFNLSEHTVIRGLLPPAPSPMPADLSATTIRFYLINFNEVFCQEPAKEGQSRRIRREMLFQVDQWRISVRPHTHTNEVVRQLRENGGFGITHIGEIRKENGERIGSEEANQLLEGLQYYFSFVRGFWCGPALSVAHGSDAEPLWESWRLPHGQAWRSVQGWCDSHSGQLAEAVFPGFYQRWTDAVWREPLQRAIYWYIGSNLGSAGVEGSTILSQTGLELLAWLWLVEHRRALTADGFERLNASDRIRLLVAEAQIAPEIPGSCGSLAVMARGQNWKDGAEAITGLRNGYVHPGKKAVKALGAPVEARMDAWVLGQSYFELLLLYFFGHTGEYCDRTGEKYVGETKPVPWAKGTPRI